MIKDYIKICFLYANQMSIYGDRGNVIILKKRAEWRGKEVIWENYNVGDYGFNFDDIDLFFFGGGQDKQQMVVASDLQKIGDKIKKQVLDKNAVMLAICGGMQLLGNYYQPLNGDKLKGIGLFDLYTEGGEERFIGNVELNSDLSGETKSLVGFENHSGRTYVNWDEQKPLGTVISGNGNNGIDGTEGVVRGNAVGSYLHGCILSKNPWLADWLLKKSLERKYGTYQLDNLDDELELNAHKNAVIIAGKVKKVINLTTKK